eukprot:s12_g15.t1
MSTSQGLFQVELTTQAPRVPIGAGGAQDLFGIPPILLVGIFILVCLVCLSAPLLYWFRRQSNLRKEYIPRA